MAPVHSFTNKHTRCCCRMILPSEKCGFYWEFGAMQSQKNVARAEIRFCTMGPVEWSLNDCCAAMGSSRNRLPSGGCFVTYGKNALTPNANKGKSEGARWQQASPSRSPHFYPIGATWWVLLKCRDISLDSLLMFNKNTKLMRVQLLCSSVCVCDSL